MSTQPRERSVSWSDPDVYRSWMEGKSGLELLTALANGTLPNPPMFELLGFRVGSAIQGEVVLEASVGEHLYHPGAIVHGGFAATLIDTATALAVRSRLPAGDRITTVEMKLNFIRSLRADSGPVTCKGTVVHFGRKVSMAEGKVFMQDGKLVAAGTASLIAL